MDSYLIFVNPRAGTAKVALTLTDEQSGRFPDVVPALEALLEGDALPAIRSFLERYGENLPAHLKNLLEETANPRNSREVMVWNLCEEKYKAWQDAREEKHGIRPGDLEMGQTFASAAEASAHLGFKSNYNRVALLLRKVGYGEGESTLAYEAGVEWRYTDTIPD